MAEHFIVMADIVGSRSYEGNALAREFSRIVDECNAVHAANILSPYTITLGDEFQGVAASLEGAIDAILFLEDRLLTVEPVFALRYVLVYGAIDTPINSQIAHRMTGSGLSLAREMLTEKKRGRPRFQVNLPGLPCADDIGMMLRLLELLSRHWSKKDFPLVRALIGGAGDSEVAVCFGKTRSQIWKRRKTLQIEEYVTVRRLIYRTIFSVEGRKT